MGIKVVLTNSSRVTKAIGSDEDAVRLPRYIYQALGSLVKNKKLGLEDIPEEYQKFLDDMGKLHDNKFYNTEYEIPEEIIKIDKYLGSLGITEEYPYSKDSISVKSWLTLDSRAEYRILVDTDTNPIGILMDGDKVLVSYAEGVINE